MSKLKIYSDAPNGNEAADLEHAHYINLAISKLKEESERLKTADMGVQIMLAHLDILLHLSDKFLSDARLLVKKKEAEDWKNTFFEWFERNDKKIPAKFRDGIKASADDLFTKLENVAR